MGFVGVYRAIYDYTAQAHEELTISEGDLLFILDKNGNDDWWKAKKAAASEDDDEPEGLVPNNYVEKAKPISNAKALYDYGRQTDEEMPLEEDQQVAVYDTSDPDWTLVGDNGEFGFAPANYLDMQDAGPPPMPTRPRAAEMTPEPEDEPSSSSGAAANPAAAIAGIIQQKTGPSSPSANRSAANIYTPETSDEEPPPLPSRASTEQQSDPRRHTASSRSIQSPGIVESPSYNHDDHGDGPTSPRGYHMYNIHEMVSHMGKNKKMPTCLGINVAKGVILIAPEKSRDGPSQEWTAEKLTHYSIEGKHVFMELVRPSKSIDFHCGGKETAQEIVTALGDLAGAVRAEGLREIIAAGQGSGEKRGVMSFEFMAQGDDEVTVAQGDEVIILDDSQSEDWWMVRRVKNGKEGVVPANFIELKSATPAPASASASASAHTSKGVSFVEQNRAEEKRLTKEAARSSKHDADSSSSAHLPERYSSLSGKDGESKRSGKRRESRNDPKSDQKSRPDSNKVRTWTDRSASFNVEAQFLGLVDGKIHLHKTNGYKIAVPTSKMSVADLEYVEKLTGRSLDDDKPLAEIKRMNTQKSNDRSRPPISPAPTSGAAVQPSTKPKYDWFDFFLQCGVNPQICERYAMAFERDQMGEENLQDIQPTLLRTLGLKEGDILRVMKHLDGKYGRVREQSATTVTNGTVSEGDGIFSGPGGALRNNTRKGRPAPAVESNTTVDPRAFEQNEIKKTQIDDAQPTPLAALPAKPQRRTTGGFDDDAWEPKPSKQASPARVSSPPAQTSIQPPARPALPSGAMSELSLLSPPLQPEPAPQPTAPPQPVSSGLQVQQTQQPQPSGATADFFNSLVKPAQPLAAQQTSQPRQRPQPPPQSQGIGSLIPPPPQRPTSAPQNNQQSGFGPPPPLRPQGTGPQSQLAPPGQSMQELSHHQMQMQMAPQQVYTQPTGFVPSQQVNNIPYQQTGYGQPQQQQPPPPPQPFQPQSQFGQLQQQQQYPGQVHQIAAQPTGYVNSGLSQPGQQQYGQQQLGGFNQAPPLAQQRTGGVNQFLPQPLQPQPTSIQPQPTSYNSFNGGFNQGGFGQQQAPPVPPIPQHLAEPAPLVAQKTGPAPPIRFGVTGGANKLQPQPTGMRANLSQATPQNPFGF